MRSPTPDSTKVRLEPWSQDDLPLLQRLLGDPVMTAHLGGPETPEKLARRHTRYVAEERSPQPRKGRSLRVVDVASQAGAGWVGYWERVWRDGEAYEMGWSILPAFQGRGLATAAAREALRIARAAGGHRFVHAFPSVNNVPSNALCERLGFELLGETALEYPPGNLMTCNDWRFDLRAEPEE